MQITPDTLDIAAFKAADAAKIQKCIGELGFLWMRE